MATSTKHNGFKRVIDRALSATLSNSFSTTDSELAVLVNGQEAMAFKPDSVGTYGHTKIGNQPAEALASIIDGYGVSLATGYSASATNRIYAFEVNADTGSTDLTGDTNVGAIKGRVVAGTTQSNCGISGIIGTLDVGTVNLISNHNGVCGVLDFYGNCTLGGSQSHVAGLAAVVWNEATTTSTGAGNSIAGVDIIQNSGSPTLTGGINPAVYIRAGTSSRWQHGVYVEPTHVQSSAFRAGNQNGEALASIVDGYGVNLAVRYSASDYEFGTSHRIYALEVNADTGSVDCTGDVNLGAIKGRMVAGTTQSNCGISGVVGTLDVGTVNLQGNHNGVCGVLDFYGNCTLGTGATCYGAGLVAVVWNEATTTLGAGAVLSGIDLVENGAVGAFGTGSLNPAVNIRGNWREGINLGACTTGILVAANTVIPQFITIGTDANPLHWDGVASNWLIHSENTDTTPPSVSCYKFQLDAAQSAATTSGRLECFRAVVTSSSTNNVTASMRALVGQTEFAGVCTYVGSDPQGCYGLVGAIHSGYQLTATGDVHPLALFFGVETNSALNGEDSFIYMYNYGKVALNSLIQVYNGATPTQNTYLLDLQNAVLGSYSGPCYTGDVNPTGSTGDNALGADGHIKILVGATPYYIPIFGTLV